MKKIFLFFLVLLVASISSTQIISLAQEEKSAVESNAIIIRKLQELSITQQEILKNLADIKEELKIIKMRTTLK